MGEAAEAEIEMKKVADRMAGLPKTFEGERNGY